MNFKKSQSYIDLTVRNWDNTEFGNTLREMCEQLENMKMIK
ncbi:hypothetical protein ABIC59_005913 [Priestia aryabhattai]|jgi:hypothetical protein